MAYNKWDIVVVPFPFTDSHKAKPRPALVLSNHDFNAKTGHSVLAMITTAGHTSWYNDIAITDLERAGLPVPSVVRCKIFTLDNRVILRTIGELGTKDKKRAAETIEGIL